MQSTLSATGALRMRKTAARKAPLSWRFKNAARPSFIWGYICYQLASLFTQLTHIPTLVGCLSLRKKLLDGTWVDYGVVSYRSVTNAAVAFIVDDWDGGVTDISLWHFHGLGTGAAAENVTDTALGVECTTALNPDSTRAVGTQTQPSANIIQSVGVLTFDATAAVTEHGLFSAATAGTLYDRSVFGVVTMNAGESLSSSYSGTFNSGG